MKYIYIKILLILFLLFFIKSKVFSQDLGILSYTSPISGCELSSNENVTVVIFNFGTPFSGSFDVNYQINGGIITTENISIPSFPSFSTYSYTFTSSADLSVANSYEFKFFTSLTGDVDVNNDTLYGNVVSDTLSYGGIINSSQSVCINGNSGQLNLNNFIGNVQNWEYSINNGSTWINIPNTSDTISYNNLTQETWYRAIVANGFCPEDTSTIAILSIDSSSIGGNISGSTTICIPPNNGNLTLSGERGSILDWEFSSNGGSSWNSLSNNSNPYNYINQPTTYLYRAVIQNGSCQIVYSDTAEVIVLNGAIGGNLSPISQSVCSGSNSGIITLSGSSGSVSSWQQSINNGVTWTSIINTSTTQPYTNLTQDTWYRAILTDCNTDTSTIAKVLINSPPIGGTLTGNDTVCINSNTGTVSLSGESGNIIDWESSINGGISWNSIGNTTNSYNYNNLSISTMYRVKIGNGTCSNVYSDTIVITVDSLAFAGTISAPSNVCILGNSGSLTLNGSIGNILDWETSINGGGTWTSLGNNSNNNSFTNITQNTLFHVIVNNGVCPNDTTQTLISVDNESNAGNLLNSDTVCFLSSGINYLNGYTGNIIDWETSLNNGISWSSTSITSDTINYYNINSQIKYRTFVQNGVCPIDTSNIISIDIFPFNITTSNDTTIFIGDSTTLFATGGIVYTWNPMSNLFSPNNNTTIASPTVTTNYIVLIEDINGCIYSDSVLVNVITPIIEDSLINSEIIIADLITANGDGYNDTWNIMGIERYPETKAVIFNSSGNLVYESSDYQNDWDGTWNGKQLPDGTYYYIIELKTKKQSFKGFVTIVSVQ